VRNDHNSGINNLSSDDDDDDDEDLKAHTLESDNENFYPSRSLNSLHNIQLANDINYSKSLTMKSSKLMQHQMKVYGDTFEHVKSYLSNASLFVVDDELIQYKLGNRPQDEISTEL
jgi:hypothetical protein